MAVNSSSNSSLRGPFYICDDSKTFMSISVFIVTKSVLLLPLSILILHQGHHQWRQQRSFAAMSHSDIFTYHLAVMELIGVFGTFFYLCGRTTDHPDLTLVGLCLFFITYFGETFFHLLTCMERYLAVLHPVTYLGLKKPGGVRIRNVIIGCVWLLCFGWMYFTAWYFPNLPYIPFSCFLIFSLIVVSFCSFSVLCVLIRPGPGEVGGARERVNQSKHRAFHTVVAIMGVLWLWFVGHLVCLALDASPVLSSTDDCVVLVYGMWFDLPSSLVLPLLFLHRAGKLPFSTRALTPSSDG